MSEFVFTTDAASGAYCREIAQAMRLFFGITRDNAVKRVNDQWQHTAILGDDNLIYHEPPDYWAKRIFFGEVGWRDGDIANRYSLIRLERRVNLILDHLGIEYKDVSQEVKRQASLGHRSQAMKLLQYESGLDLRECFDIVKRLEAEMGLPEKP